MDQSLIEEKLEALQRCIRRIEEKRPSAAKILATDSDLQDIISLNLTRAVQICVDIAAHIIADHNIPAPQTMSQAFEVLADLNVINSSLADRMKKSVGFRNIAVHNYQAIDWQIVYNISTKNLEDFRGFAKAVSKLID